MKNELYFGCVLVAIACCASAQQLSDLPEYREPKSEAIKKLLPLFGGIASSSGPQSPVTEEAIRKSFEIAGKVSSAMTEKLGADNHSSGSFVKLPEFIAEIDSWSVRPEYVDLVPDNHVSMGELKKVLGPVCKTNTTHNTMVSGAFKDVNWLCYGRWHFGSTGDDVEIVRVQFAKGK